jgi:hypothetical protein
MNLPRGRPRDQVADAKILKAAMCLLEQHLRGNDGGGSLILFHRLSPVGYFHSDSCITTQAAYRENALSPGAYRP